MYFIYFFQPLKVRTENASRLFDLKSAVLAYRAKTMKGFNNSNFCLLFKVYVSVSYRMVSCLQRMLSLALEVDCSPALTSAKLSQELFHMLISNVPLRAHR